MNENIWKKLNYYIGLIPLGMLFGLVAFVATLELKDLDIWLHIATGRFIMENGFVPSFDVLSNSIAGQPWDNHEWLFQVIVYNLYNTFGVDGLLNMQVVVVTLTMLVLMFIGYSKEKQFTMTFTLLLVFMVFQQRFTVRPDLYSLFFFAIYIFVLAIHIDKRWARLTLFITQVLWVNMHGFFFFGPLFVLIGIISEWLRRNVKLPLEWNNSGNLADDEYKQLKSIFVFVVLACFINPGFIKGAWYPIGVFFSLGGDSKIFFEYIQELQKPVTWENIFDLNRYVYYKLLILLSGISFFFNRRRIDISALIFWIIFLIFSLKATRNLSYFAFAAYLVIITNLYSIDLSKLLPLNFSNPRFKYITVIFLKVLLLVWIVQYSQTLWRKGYYDFDNYTMKSEFGGQTKLGFPHKAVDFLVDNEVKGNFFNDFNSGAYLLGRTHPNIKVFIDGRTEAYGSEFFLKYREIKNEGNTQLFESAVQKFGLTGVLFNSSSSHIRKEFLQYIHDHKDWIPVYFDYDGLVYLKDIEENRLWIKEHKINFNNLDPKQIDLFKLGPRRVPPFHNFFRAYTLESLGYVDLAKVEIERALKINPAYAGPYALLGKIHADEKEFTKAFEYFRLAVSLAPRDKDYRYKLAQALTDLREYDYALKEYGAIYGKWPKDPKALMFAGKVSALKGDYKEAQEFVGKAIKLDPKIGSDIARIGDIIYEEEEFEVALKFYQWANEQKPDLVDIQIKIAKTLSVLNRAEEAIKLLNDALEKNPDSDEIKKELKDLGAGV